jgi:hypothetical protein
MRESLYAVSHQISARPEKIVFSWQVRPDLSRIPTDRPSLLAVEQAQHLAESLAQTID